MIAGQWQAALAREALEMSKRLKRLMDSLEDGGQVLLVRCAGLRYGSVDRLRSFVVAMDVATNLAGQVGDGRKDAAPSPPADQY
jgi:hypothetical protein